MFQVNMSKHLEDELFFKLVHTINNHITYVVIIYEPQPPWDVYNCNKSNTFVYVAFVSDRCISVDFILIKTDMSENSFKTIIHNYNLHYNIE